MMRLDRYLAARTGLTRSESRKAIAKGRVAVEGAVCRKADTQVPEDAAILLDGAPLAGAYRKFVYLMLNKPAGVVSASRDKTGYHGSGPGGDRLPPARAVPGGAAGQDQHRLRAADRRRRAGP